MSAASSSSLLPELGPVEPAGVAGVDFGSANVLSRVGGGECRGSQFFFVDGVVPLGCALD